MYISIVSVGSCVEGNEQGWKVDNAQCFLYSARVHSRAVIEMLPRTWNFFQFSL
jgi:hypothetical protein